MINKLRRLHKVFKGAGLYDETIDALIDAIPGVNELELVAKVVKVVAPTVIDIVDGDDDDDEDEYYDESDEEYSRSMPVIQAVAEIPEANLESFLDELVGDLAASALYEKGMLEGTVLNAEDYSVSVESHETPDDLVELDLKLTFPKPT